MKLRASWSLPCLTVPRKYVQLSFSRINRVCAQKGSPCQAHLTVSGVTMGGLETWGRTADGDGKWDSGTKFSSKLRFHLHCLALHLHLALGLRRKRILSLRKKRRWRKWQSRWSLLHEKSNHSLWKGSSTPILTLKTEVWITVVLSWDE